jgi:hypothetical protein
MTQLRDDIRLRDEALSMMDKRGAILDTAREVSAWLRDSDVKAPVIGGVAVVLHGHWRATRDIDVLAISPLEELADVLQSHGFLLDAARREFIRAGIPIHIVTPEQTGSPIRDLVEIDGVVTVSLPDLITMKLRSGTKNLLRAQDLADVIGLIRCHQLRGDFARQLDRPLRPTFRKLARAIEQEVPH